MAAQPHPAVCPKAEALARLADERLAPAERAQLEGHVGVCPLCRAVVAGLARAQGRAAPSSFASLGRAGAASVPTAAPAPGPRSLWWVPLATHAALALIVGVVAWWLFGGARP